jgi:geranylgeranylglycerol-phosphate geranylgeranyltransferase
VHPFPSLLVTTLTVALALLAGGRSSLGLVTQLGAGMLLFQSAIGITNDVADSADDAASKPWKPIPRGAVSRERAMLFAVLCAAGGMTVTITLPLNAWLIGIAGLSCGLGYDVFLKRTVLSWAPYAMAIPLLPAWVYAALESWSSLLWWTFPLGALLGLALHLANQLPDLQQDSRRGIRSAVQRVGSQRTFAGAMASFGMAASLAVVVLLFESPARALLAAVDAGFAAILATRATRIFGRDGLFGLMAAAAAILAVVFLSAV